MEITQNYKIEEDVRQSENYGKFMQKIGWKTVVLKNEQIFVRRLGPVGIAKLQRSKIPLPWEEIQNVLTKEHVMMCKIEPTCPDFPEQQVREELNNHGFMISKEPLLGTKTLRVDLRPSEDTILSSFKKDARYILRKLQNPHIKLQINDFVSFYKIWKMSAKRKNLWIPGKTDYNAIVDSFGKNVFCLDADQEAGALVLVHKNTAFYYYAGATKAGTEKNLPYLILWSAMKEAKKRGCTVWDFEGIYDARWPNKGWAGFSHFKKSFGGMEIDFPGSYTKWRWPF